MTTTAIMKTVSGTVNKLGFKFKKHSPEILVVAGVIGTVTSAVLACKATIKAKDILEETKNNLDQIHECAADQSLREEGKYTEEDKKRDLVTVYAQTGVNLVKLYAPSIVLGALSIAGILTSNNILRKRNVALAAAYATVDKSFKDYRKRVIEKLGEAADKEFKYNLKSKKITETVKDEETGEEKKVKKEIFVVNPSDVSEYARFFEKYTADEQGNSILNPYWNNDNEYNLMFLKAQERFANDILISKGRLFLNDVYKMLGLPATKAGQIVGWVYDPENKLGRDEDTFNNYVSFGMYNDNLSYSDFANGFDPAILLDFNVDGNIWELM